MMVCVLSSGPRRVLIYLLVLVLVKFRFGMALTARTGVLAWNSCILTSRSRDMNILQHDMRFSSDYISQLVGHKSEVCGLKWSTNERELASVGNENQVGGEP